MVVILRLGTHPNHKSSTTTGFKIYPLLGTLPEFLLNSHRFLEWTTGILSTCPTNTAVFCRPGKIWSKAVAMARRQCFPRGPDVAVMEGCRGGVASPRWLSADVPPR
ncbi:hypothetical protein RJ640_029586 [Escallonia rubra]|uniref:Uncharacterized protein n=1 Tax=Escallonia rubra TaxID=112253 RepID=A0AA88RD73_9ASTE|nr:hypothetical protein RJ640_029586 [Escallonia rubra]